MRSVRVALVTMGLLGCVGSGAYAQQASPVTLGQMAIEGAFAGKKAGDAATDISGMACLPEGAPRKCLLVNDENKNAQFAAIDDDRMVVGDVVPLIGSAADHGRSDAHRTRPARNQMISRIWMVKGSLMPRPIFMSSVLTDADAQAESFDCLPLSSRG